MAGVIGQCSICCDKPEYKKEFDEKKEAAITCIHGRYWFKDTKFYEWNRCMCDKDDR
jgi:hypothetical protein